MGQLALYPENAEVQGLQVTHPPVVQRLQTGMAAIRKPTGTGWGVAHTWFPSLRVVGTTVSLMAVRRVRVGAAPHSSL